MPISKGFIEFVVEGLEPLGDVSVRNMFGGAGVYIDGRMMGLLAGEALYFKVDDVNREEFEDCGCTAFQYEKKDGEVATMSYYSAPEEVFDDPDEMIYWGRLAMDAAFRSK